jgi:uncharacterized membrane protein
MLATIPQRVTDLVTVVTLLDRTFFSPVPGLVATKTELFGTILGIMSRFQTSLAAMRIWTVVSTVADLVAVLALLLSVRCGAGI